MGKGRRGGCKDKPENRMWIGNLPVIEDREKRREAEDKLKELLQKKCAECKFASISRSSGHGVATFPSAEEVQDAIQALAGTKFRGKVLSLTCGKSRRRNEFRHGVRTFCACAFFSDGGAHS